MYCDGLGFQGSRQQPVKYENKKIYVRGKDIVIESLELLNDKLQLWRNANNIIIGGDGSGGVSSMLWSNYIKDKSIKADVRVFAQNAIFMQSVNIKTGLGQIQQLMRTIMQISHQQEQFKSQQINFPITECVDQFPNTPFYCMFPSYILRYMEVPIFISQPIYPIQSMYFIIGAQCLQEEKSLLKCTQHEMEAIAKYRDALITLLDQVGRDTKKSNAVWTTGCNKKDNKGSWKDEIFIDQNTIQKQKMLVKWISNNKQNSKQNYINIQKQQWAAGTLC